MPTQDFGVYEDSLTLGTEVSSTYEGRHITLHASEINEGSVLAVVTKGYPVIFGPLGTPYGVGVALNTEVAGGVDEFIAIDTEGIWNLSVLGADDSGNSLVRGGELIYINTTTCVLSKISSTATNIPFGYALGQANDDGLAHTIAVKVHFDPGIPVEFFGAKTFNDPVTMDSTLTVAGSLNALEHFSVAYDATIGRDLSVLQHFSVAFNAIVGNDLTVAGHLGTLRAHVGNGATFTGAITNLTVEDGIVTAAS